MLLVFSCVVVGCVLVVEQEVVGGSGDGGCCSVVGMGTGQIEARVMNVSVGYTSTYHYNQRLMWSRPQ